MIVDNLVKARETKQAVERPTKVEPKMELARAYGLQKELVNKLLSAKKDKIVGYKLSPKTVNDKPVYGYLFESMILPDGAKLIKKDYIDLHLENEVAFIIGKEIKSGDVKTAADLKPYVKFVVPAIELPEIRYSGKIDDVNGIDLVVDNVVASKLILGEGRGVSEVDADSVNVKMLHNGRVINEGKSTLVEGSPWNSLLWLVRELDKKGETLKPNQIIMTGGIAKFMDSLPGSYEATYSNLGKIAFKVE